MLVEYIVQGVRGLIICQLISLILPQSCLHSAKKILASAELKFENNIKSGLHTERKNRRKMSTLVVLLGTPNPGLCHLHPHMEKE